MDRIRKAEERKARIQALQDSSDTAGAAKGKQKPARRASINMVMAVVVYILCIF